MEMNITFTIYIVNILPEKTRDYLVGLMIY